MKLFNTIYELKSFLILWSSQTVSALGTAMTNYALVIWAYQQKGTASSITLLSVCSFLPSILFCFAAGTLADRWDKKRLMLVSDTVAAMGTATILLLYSTGTLQLWHLYIINFTLSFMNAFQNPAALVAQSLIVPEKHYARTSGLQAFANSLVTVLTPAIAVALLAFGGIQTVLIVDLSTFAVAFLALLLFIKIPPIRQSGEAKAPFLQECLSGLRFLREHRALFSLILFFSFVNLLASLSGNGIMPAMILSRSNQNQLALGAVSSAVGIGMLVGSILATAAPPAKRRTRVIFITCAVSFFLCDVFWGLGRSVPVWVFAAFAGNLPLPFIGVNITTIMRTKVPIEMQGRVFATRDTLQFTTIPLGLFLGGVLADNVFEPFMLSPSPLQHALSFLVGTGKGSGMAVIFLVIGVVGFAANLLCLRNPIFKELDT
ncbi:MFS transporter [Acetanaerobacterium elongatum]|uniref:Major Facilitator Superfamily protein n=1 Tax=Acetanaerobacterium elongatum TaxID=258515 RepID=A0A1H0G4R3_9FIRM|nr:MFS transporter [Acetanaerobacterium elongatum]SDO01895.1 Major Facilitator Superfamily protein [Acetanaerobacterium elongatum]